MHKRARGELARDPPATKNSYVVAATSGKIRTFLYELAEGTSNYRSLHSLTEQVEHQYHGRFIVELIQNAHDALYPSAKWTRRSARIEIAQVGANGKREGCVPLCATSFVLSASSRRSIPARIWSSDSEA